MGSQIKKRGRPKYKKNGISNPTRRRIKDHWMSRENVFKSESYSEGDRKAERFGKAFLEMNGWDYVWWFSEHENNSNIENERKYSHHPFDYYAEKGSEVWFIDATKNYTKNLNIALLEPYLRRHKIGYLFIRPDAKRVIFREISKVTGGINVTLGLLGLGPLRKRRGVLEFAEEENLPNLDDLT